VVSIAVFRLDHRQSVVVVGVEQDIPKLWNDWSFGLETLGQM
jgi:hypothetical protein